MGLHTIFAHIRYITVYILHTSYITQYIRHTLYYNDILNLIHDIYNILHEYTSQQKF
jgi:hypothetical protein